MKPVPPDVALTPESKCLNCGHRINAVSTCDDTPALPRPGDVAACIKCGAIMVLDESLRVRGFTEQEADDFLADSEAFAEMARLVKGIYLVRHRLS